MSLAAVLLAAEVWTALLAFGATPPPAAPPAATAPAEPQAPPSPAPPPSPSRSTYRQPRRYGDQGTSELALGLGYSSYSGLLAAGGFRYFVVDGLAPGVDLTYVGGGAYFSQVGLLLAALRLVPVRTSNAALVLTGRAGRVVLGDHADGWAAGGAAGVIIFLGGSGNVGLELGYEALRLLPASFCADLWSCVLHGPVFGLRVSF